jgi:hypothetical protein
LNDFASSIKRGQEPKCGHERPLLSRWAVYISGQLHLVLGLELEGQF